MMTKRKLDIRPFPEDAARRISQIIGPYSAAGNALRELEKRRSNGESVGLFEGGGMFLVGPSAGPPPPPASPAIDS